MTAEGGAAAAATRWAAVAATALACGLGPCGVAAAAAVSEPQAGYWWLPEPVSGLIPVPGVPPNGLYLASTPTGPQAVSAVRFAVSDPSAVVRLTLHVSPQEQVGTPAVVAYPATGRWQVSGPQPWSARPSYRSGAKPIVGVFQGRKLMTLTFPAREASTGIVLLPDPRAGNKTFTIAFTPPHSADVSVRSTASSSPSASASTVSSHHPRPTRTHRSVSPSATPTHAHKPHQPAKSPSASSPPTDVPTPASRPTPSAAGSTSPALPAAASDSGHSARNAVVIGLAVAALLILFTALRVTVSRRRPPNEG